MEASRGPRRGEVFWVNLDPAVGTEIKKTRPAVVLSNDEQNEVGQRVLVAPLTSNVSRLYSFEALIAVEGRPSKAMLDQVRCVDQSRLGRRICAISNEEIRRIEKALKVAFDLE